MPLAPQRTQKKCTDKIKPKLYLINKVLHEKERCATIYHEDINNLGFFEILWKFRWLLMSIFLKFDQRMAKWNTECF